MPYGGLCDAMIVPLLLLLVAAQSAAAAPRRRDLGASWGGEAGAAGSGAGAGRTLSELRESELERYAFLMLDPAASGVGDPIPAGTVTRRITPKSVFIAPSINGDQCAEGYQQDDMGRCVKVVKVDAEKSWDLLLDRLNNQFASDMDTVPESTPPPGPPPGPLQVAIPIAETAPGPSESEPPPPRPPPPQDLPVSVSSSTTEQTELPSDVAEITTSSAVEEATTTATEHGEDDELKGTPLDVAAQEDTDLVPEVVMVSSEEYLQPLPHIISSPPAETVDTTAQASALLSSDLGNVTGSDARDTNPIINTVNSSLLVTGHAADASNPVAVSVATDATPKSVSSTASYNVSSTSSSIETGAAEVPISTSPLTPIISSTDSTSESPSHAGPLPESAQSTATATEPSQSPSTPSESTSMSMSSSSTMRDVASPALEDSLPSSTTSATVTQSSSSSSSSWSSSSEEQGAWHGPVGNRLRPASAPEAVRFPTEKPTLFRTATGTVRFPTIDVTFPTGGAASRPDANWLREKPIKFPKDDQVNLWRLPPPPSPASNWSLEQTRNKPYLFRYWSRSPSRLSPANLGDSLGLSSSSRDSVENVSGQLPSSIWPPAPSPHSHQSTRQQQTGNSFEFRRSSTIYNGRPHLTQSHRRGREW